MNKYGCHRSEYLLPTFHHFLLQIISEQHKLASMWTPILALHLYEITRQKPNSPIIISCCTPYNLGQKHRTAKAHKEVLKQFFHFGIQFSLYLYLSSYWCTWQFTTVASFRPAETQLSRDILVIFLQASLHVASWQRKIQHNLHEAVHCHHNVNRNALLHDWTGIVPLVPH